MSIKKDSSQKFKCSKFIKQRIINRMRDKTLLFLVRKADSFGRIEKGELIRVLASRYRFDRRFATLMIELLVLDNILEVRNEVLVLKKFDQKIRQQLFQKWVMGDMKRTGCEKGESPAVVVPALAKATEEVINRA